MITQCLKSDSICGRLRFFGPNYKTGKRQRGVEIHYSPSMLENSPEVAGETTVYQVRWPARIHRSSLTGCVLHCCVQLCTFGELLLPFCTFGNRIFQSSVA